MSEPNQVYPSVPAPMDTVDPNLPTLAPADKALEVKEEYTTRYTRGGRGGRTCIKWLDTLY